VLSVGSPGCLVTTLNTQYQHPPMQSDIGIYRGILD